MFIIRWSLLTVFTIALSACAGHQAVQQPAVETTAPVKQQLGVIAPAQIVPQPTNPVLAMARNMLGTPYRYGGADPSGFDCSGLVSYVYRSAGIRVPRTSQEQYRQSFPVATDQLQAGDLLFFRLRPPKISHVAIYEGEGRFIHAPSSGKRVSYASLENPYWKQHLIGAGRF